MIIAAIALVVAQPPVFRPLPQGPQAPTEMPARPWDNQNYAMQCEVSNAARARGQFALALTTLGSARISGDTHFGLNTERMVLTNEGPPVEHPDVLIRTVAFDAGNLTYVTVTQAFHRGELQSTSLIARHTIQSDGIPNSHQVLGFCYPATIRSESGQ